MRMESLNQLVIRTAAMGDAEGILNIQKEVVEEGDFLLMDSVEFNKTIADQKQWIQRILQNKREILLIADVADKMAGWLVFQSPNRVRLNHTGSIGMMVKKEFRNRQVGRKLLETLLVWAEQHKEIEKICLGVLSSNDRAIHLYRSLGFLEEGRKVNEVKIGDRYVDDILMYKDVKKR